MTIYIVDDEKNNRELLKELVDEFFKAYTVVGEAEDAESAYDDIIQLNPDLVLLDIQMPKGNGFTLLKRFPKIPFYVIFITSFDQYAIEAIKVNALDYLLKPIDISLLKLAFEKAELSLKEKDKQSTHIINLIKNLDEFEEDKRLTIHEKDKVRMVYISDIIYLEGDVNYTNIFTHQDKFTSSKSIKEFEDFLIAESTFVRIHRKYIINTKCLSYYEKGDPFYVIMSNGARLEASRRKKAEVLSKLI